MAAPRRVSEGLFRRDMVGPSFGHFAASMTGLLLIEKVCLELLMPPWIPTTEAFFNSLGRTTAFYVSSGLFSALIFWGFGTLFFLPALLGVKKWKIQANKALDMNMLWKSLPLIAFNFSLGTALVPLVLLACLPESSWDWHALPSTKTLARDILVWLLVEEITFFYGHKLFHENKFLYAKIHKLHHTWTAPISFVAIFCHPVEHIVSNITPLMLGPLLCGSHVAAIGVFTSAGLVHTLAVHSGYWFCDDDGMHDEHHAKFNVNYGVLGLLDYLHGTLQLPQGAAGRSNASLAEAKSSKLG